MYTVKGIKDNISIINSSTIFKCPIFEDWKCFENIFFIQFISEFSHYLSHLNSLQCSTLAWYWPWHTIAVLCQHHLQYIFSFIISSQQTQSVKGFFKWPFIANNLHFANLWLSFQFIMFQCSDINPRLLHQKDGMHRMHRMTTCY